MTSDIEVVTAAADTIEHRLTPEPPRLDPHPTTYRDLIDRLDKASFIDFGHHII